MKELFKSYQLKKKEIISSLEKFKTLAEESRYNEFLFCLLTPQSNAQRCWQAVEQISQLKKIEEQSVFNILKTKTRFHKTKTTRILQAKENWDKIKPYLKNENIQKLASGNEILDDQDANSKEEKHLDVKELRNFIAKTVNGYGLKEASHFLRNIGLSNNQIAILDRHILKNLRAVNLIQETKIKSQKNYLEVESLFINFAKSISIPTDHLDLLWWSQENGEIFK